LSINVSRVAAIAAIVAACLVGAPARAQTAYGPGGLLVHPSALLPATGSVDLNVSWYTQRISGRPSSQWIPASLAYTPTSRFQVGALFLDRVSADRSRASAGLFGKYLLTPDAESHPAVALVGSFYAGDVRLASAALVASHAFRRGERTLFIAHLGVQLARRSDIPNPQDSLAGFAGLEAPIGRQFSLVAEYGTRFSFDAKETSSIGLVWRSRGGAQVGVGLVNAGRSSGNGFFVGVGYPLGGNR
jgi:hypothetical protein